MVRLAAVSYLPTSMAASGSSRHSAVRNWLLNRSNDLSWRRSGATDFKCGSATAATAGAACAIALPWLPCTALLPLAALLPDPLPCAVACALLLPCVPVAAWAAVFLWWVVAPATIGALAQAASITASAIFVLIMCSASNRGRDAWPSTQADASRRSVGDYH